jgi:ATP/maltotriose-dependent transcriptional regulator MalT
VTTILQPLVGRDSELQVLEQLLEEARRGSSRFVVVSGEPGIGKSSVLAEAARRAQALGWLVLEGRATELERVFPFGLFVDAFDAHLESLDARAFGRLAADKLEELASVFPALRSLRPDAALLTTAAERFRAHQAARDLIERLAARRPLLLALDDVHWSDGASLELIGHLLRRAPEAVVVVAMTMRSGQAPSPLAVAVDEATRAGHCRQLLLQPLGREDAKLLVTPGGTEADLLYQESGGNPFYLLQLARSPAGHAAAASAAAAAPELPPAIAAAIAAELDALPEPSRTFAQAAAVVGDPFDLDVAMETTPMSEAAALAALDELIACDVLRPAALPRHFRFRHPLVRKAIYAASPPGTRLVAHERAGAALEERGASATVRAHHVAQSARHGDVAAVSVLREAGLDAAQRAPSSAALWFASALRILPPSAPPLERAGLLMALAGANGAIGRLGDSRDALLEALDLMPAEDLLAQARLVSACTTIELLLGRFEAAHTRLTDALAKLAQPSSAAGARVMMDLALNAFYGTDYDGMRQWALKALDVARPLGDRALVSATLGILALAESTDGPVADAEEHCSEAAALIDAMDDDELAVWLDGLAHLCGAEYCLDRFDAAARHAERGLALGRATGRGEFFPGMSQAWAGAMWATGRLSEAAELVDGIVEAARLSDNALGLAWGLLNRGYISLASGDIDNALRESEEAVALTRDMEPGVVSAWAGGVHGAALTDAGQHERAIELMVRSGGGDELPRVPGPFRANFLEILTRALLASGRLAEADRAAVCARRRAELFGLNVSTAVAERATAAVALASGDAAAAAEWARGSAERADRAGARVEAAVSRTLAGRALIAAGEPERAVAELERAAEELDACGARRHREAAERELRRLGRGVHRRSAPGKQGATGLESLTGRELEVTELVVDRRTNPEIAAELFLSIKTVETHLRNIFRKLDVSSRVEVARAVERGGSG